MTDAGFGIYLHWPFCQSKCPYCDFNSHVWDRIDQSVWKAAYLSEIDRYAGLVGDRLVRSIYFGGGTPSLMDPDVVEAVIAGIQARWRLENDVEITLEANPSSVEADRFRAFRRAGVNRVSLGVQALDSEDLRRLGRLHSVEDALRALSVARETFDRVSFDLIYARQHQTVDGWSNELNRALSFDPGHLSLYQLTIEEGTAFHERYQRGGLKGLPDEDLGADLWAATQDLCETAGLPAYEVSNHAKTGQEGRHNLIYWNGGDYAGIGPGAHGRLTLGTDRFGTEATGSPGAWLKAVQAGSGAHEEMVELSAGDRLKERMIMGLRLAAGIDLNPIEMRLFSNNIIELKGSHLIETNGPRIRLTAQGRPVLNSVLAELFRGID